MSLLNNEEENIINEIVEKTEKLKAIGLGMETIKRLLVNDFKILDKFPTKKGEFGTEYEVLQIAESGVKLQKPKVLKGIKPFGNIGYGEKQRAYLYDGTGQHDRNLH